MFFSVFVTTLALVRINAPQVRFRENLNLTGTILAQAIYAEGSKMVAAGTNPMELKRGVDKAVITVVEELAKIALVANVCARVSVHKRGSVLQLRDRVAACTPPTTLCGLFVLH